MSSLKDSTFRVGARWFNPAHVSLAEMVPPVPPATQPGVKLHMADSSGALIWEFHGDEAEAVFKELGYDKAAREAEAAAKLKAIHDAEQAAAKAEAEAAKKTEQEAKVAHEPH